MLVILTVYPFTTSVYAAISNPASTPRITYAGQVVDSITYRGSTINAVYTPYRDGLATDWTYGCFVLPRTFYSTIYGITVSNLNSTTSIPNASSGYFQETRSPRKGDIIRCNNYVHWALVKKVNGTTVTIIQQNAWWNSYTCAQVGNTVSSSDLSVSFFTYSGYLPDGNTDTEPPSLSNIYQDGFSNTGYTLHFTATDNVGLKYVTIYTNVNGENRKEENINLSGTRQDVSYSVRYSDFNTSTGYRHGIWVYDTAGNKYQSDWIVVDSEKPVCENAYINYVTENSYRVNIVPKDNVGIKAVSVATWTQSNQSDLQWHDALYNGYGTYFIDIYRADYSATQNSYYFNHAYIYDTAGNLTVVSCPQDYKITSDIGKTIPEGEYRIVTAVNETKGLDVENGSLESHANIQIFSNLSYPNQTFLLTYLDNGFYTIANSISKCVLDVAGDTYINNTNVQQFTANGGPNQEWMIKQTGDGYYYIVSRTNGLALDVTNGEDRDGANVAVHTQNQATAQKWKLRRVLKDSMVTVVASTQSGSATVNSTVTVTVDGKVLTEGKDYNITTSYNSTTRAFTVNIEGTGDYCDKVTKKVTATVIEPTQPLTSPPTGLPTTPTEQPTTSSEPTTPTEPQTIILGDVDGDEEVTIIDATAIQRHLASLPTAAYIEKAADADGDGSVTILDATAIQRHLAQLPTNENIGKPIA